MADVTSERSQWRPSMLSAWAAGGYILVADPGPSTAHKAPTRSAMSLEDAIDRYLLQQTAAVRCTYHCAIMSTSNQFYMKITHKPIGHNCLLLTYPLNSVDQCKVVQLLL